MVRRFSQVASSQKSASEVLRQEMRRGWLKPELAQVIAIPGVV
jgi:hypothetical protein